MVRSIPMESKESLVDEESDRYGEFVLLRSLLANQSTRNAALRWEGRHQMQFQQSNEGWWKTIWMIRGRGLDYLIWPWALCVLHSIAYVVVTRSIQARDPPLALLGSWEVVFTFVLNSTLAFLLVFRLNRAAERYWDARRFWGDIVALSRSIVSGILVHAPNGKDRDEVLRWLGVFAIATMELLRGHGAAGKNGNSPANDYPIDCFAGFLTPSQVRSLQQKSHPPIFAANRMRYHLKRLFPVHSDEVVSVAIANATQMDRFEEQLNSLIRYCGGMERIKATPLPIVYVSHLRTFLLINLLLFPWVFGPSWGWSTIPIVAVSAFAWIGIDAASVEVESPFKQVRVNALNMNSYVLALLDMIQDQMVQTADHEIEL